MRTTVLMLFILASCASCQDTPDNFFKDQQSSPEFVIERAVGLDGIERDYISIEKSVCRERDYEISLDFIGSRGKVTQNGIQKCNLILGYTPQRSKRQVDFFKWIRLQIRNGEEIKIEEDQN